MIRGTAYRTVSFAFLFALMAGPAYAQKWTNFAYVSATSTLVTNTLCYSDGRDLACDGASGLLVTSGTVSIPTLYATTVSTTNLSVNGVAITGNGAGDRIISGTTSMVANTGTSIISITNAGITAGYFNSNGVLTAPGISATQNLTSVTTLYASGSVGIGTASPNYPLDVSNGVINGGHFLATTSSTVNTNYLHMASYPNTQAGTLFGQAFANTVALWVSSSNPFLFGAQNSTSIVLGTNNAERMRIDSSGNLGIGTSTPGFKLDVSGWAQFTDTNSNVILLGTAVPFGKKGMNIYYDFSLDAGLIQSIYQGTAYKPTLINPSGGNVAIGMPATPSMTLTVNGELQVSNSGVACSSDTAGGIRYSGGSVLYCNGSKWTGLVTSGGGTNGDRIVSGSTSMVAQANSNVISITNAGVTTGYFNSNGVLTTPGISVTANLASVTSLYASGNVGIGTLVSGSGVDISGAFHTTNNTTAPPPSDVRGGLSVAWNRSGGRAEVNLYNAYENANTSYIFSQKTGASTYTDIMTLLGNGNVGVATRSPSTTLHVAGTVIFGPNGSPLTSGGIQFETAGTNGRIDIGRGNADTVEEFYYNGVGRVGGISINTASTSYNTTSDRRLKENIVDTTRGLADLGRIHVQDFNFIADPSRARVQGFIAQDLYKVYPEAVTVGGDDPKKKPWSVDYGRLTPLLVKSLQQQQQQIEALKAANDNQTSEIRELRKEISELKAARK